MQRWVKIEIWKEKNCKTRIERGRPSGLIIVPHFDVTGSNHEWEFFSPICPRLIEVWIFEELLVFEQWNINIWHGYFFCISLKKAFLKYCFARVNDWNIWLKKKPLLFIKRSDLAFSNIFTRMILVVPTTTTTTTCTKRKAGKNLSAAHCTATLHRLGERDVIFLILTRVGLATAWDGF